MSITEKYLKYRIENGVALLKLGKTEYVEKALMGASLPLEIHRRLQKFYARKYLFFKWALIALLLTGCATEQLSYTEQRALEPKRVYAPWSSTTLPNMGISLDNLSPHDNDKLCVAYYRTQDKTIRAELESRNALSASDWALVDSRNTAYGMKYTSLLCLKGMPIDSHYVSTIGVGTRKTLKYSEYDYIHMTNGMITGYSN